MPGQNDSKVVFADLFAGCGGLSLGLLQAGLEGRFAVEHDRFAFATLGANLLQKDSRYKFSWPAWFPKEPIAIGRFLSNHEKELRSLRGKIDVLVGGPPCQGFSSAGRRQHDDPRNKLFNYYLKVVDTLQPRAVLIENVRGFTVDFETGKRVKNYSAKLREKLSEKYDVHERLLDLAQFGVPQRRTRYFLLAIQPGLCTEDPFEVLARRLPSFLRAMRLQTPVPSRAAISDLEISRGGTRPSKESKGFEEIRYTKPLTHFQKLMGAGEAHPTDLRLARHTDEVKKRFKKIIELSHAEGRLNIAISADVRARFGLQKRALRVMDPDYPAPTITSLPDDLLHYREPRTLTVRENARLQTFPDWYRFKGKYTTGGHLRRKEVPRFTQVANAVPPLVANAFGQLLIEILGATKNKRTVVRKSQSSLKSRQKTPKVAA